MRTLRHFAGLVSTGLTLAAAPAFAQDDDLGDILADPDSSGSETEVTQEDAQGEEKIDLAEDGGKKERQVIKTLQRKTFLKLGRFEASPHAAFVANDPFLNRYIVGAGLGYHITEIFAVEGRFDYAPDLGEGDWKPLTKQLVDENSVSPDISKLTMAGSMVFQYSPIYGKVALSGRKIVNFDIFGNFGVGFVRTRDDLEALQATEEENPEAVATEIQTHPTTNFGGGLRVIFGDTVAARLEARSLIYIETVNSTTLEMKNNLIIQASVAFFFPQMRDTASKPSPAAASDE
jgi:outer membrane beta-barrel protein